MRVLIVGGGSVGATLGYALTRAGVEIDYALKREHAGESARGFRVFRIGQRGEQDRFRPRLLLTEWEDVAAAGPYDVVLVTVPADALRAPWFDAMVEAVGSARIVSFQRGVGDDAWAEERAPGARLERGLIGFLAYEAPLEGSSAVRLGTAFWTPPLSKTLFEASEPGALAPLASALTRGGLPSKETPEIEAKSLAGELLCMTLVMALEPLGYDLDALAARRDVAARAVEATREASHVIAALHDIAPPLIARRVTPRALVLGLRAARMGAPFSLEAYLRAHFTKVRPQMARNRELLIDEAGRLGLPVIALRAAHEALTPAMEDARAPERARL